MPCLRNSQCKLKIMYLPMADYVKWYAFDKTTADKDNYTVYPVDSIGTDYAKWVDQTLVKGDGNYIPYAEWVILKLFISIKRKYPYKIFVRAHFEIMYD